MDDLAIPVLVLALFFGFVYAAFMENRRTIAWVRKYQGSPDRISTVHPVDVTAGTCETTYGRSVRPMADAAEYEGHLLRIYLDERGMTALPEPALAWVDPTRWQNLILKTVIPAADACYSKWVFFLLQNVVHHIYPSLADVLLTSLRRDRAAAVCKAVALKGGSVWVDSRARAVGDMFSLKFGCDSIKFEVFWVDLFDIAHQARPTAVKLPLLLRTVGEGTYFNPHRIDVSDPYLTARRSLLPADGCMESSKPCDLAPGIHTVYWSKKQSSTLSNSRSSYTSLRDALVEQGRPQEAQRSNGELCVLFTDEAVPEVPEEDCVLQTDWGVSPLDLKLLKIVPRHSPDREDRISKLTKPVLKLFQSPHPIPPFPSSFANKLLLRASVVLVCLNLALLRHALFLNQISLNVFFGLFSLCSPPLANEACIAGAIAWLCVGQREVGREVVRLAVTALPGDLLTFTVFLLVPDFWSVGMVVMFIGSKWLLCALVNRVMLDAAKEV